MGLFFFMKHVEQAWKLNPKDENASYSANVPPHRENLTQKTKTKTKPKTQAIL